MMKFLTLKGILLSVVRVLGIAVAVLGAATTHAQTQASTVTVSPGFGKQMVIGYYLPSPEFPVSAIDATKAKKLTHINYAFVTVQNGQVQFLKQDINARNNIQQLQALKQQNPRLKICASLGGWSETNLDERASNNRIHYEAAIATDSSRSAFAKNAKSFMLANGFDCFDIDMEHPGWLNTTGPSAEGFKEAYNFGKLLEALKTEFNGQHELSVAATGSFWFLQFHHPFIENWVQSLTFVNLMTYDLSGSWDKWTGHNSPLYGSATPPPGMATSSGYYNFMRDASYLAPAWENYARQAAGAPNGRFPNYPLTLDTLVKELRMLGVPKSKIVLGVPFYGRAFKGVPNSNNGLFQAHSTEGGDPYTGDPSWIAGCQPCIDRKEPRFVTYSEVKTMLASNVGYNAYRDQEALVPYLYNAAKGVYITYDDVTSIKHKAGYILENGLAGGMFWHLGQDTKDGELLTALHSVLNGTPGEAAQFTTATSRGARYTAWMPTPEVFDSNKNYPYNAIVVDSAGNVWRAANPQAGKQPNGNTGWALLGVKKNEGIAYHPLQVQKLGAGDLSNGMNVTVTTAGIATSSNTSSTNTSSGSIGTGTSTSSTASISQASTNTAGAAPSASSSTVSVPVANVPVATPGVPQVAWMAPSAVVNSVVSVQWNLWWGQRAEKWRLLVNGNPVGDYSTAFDQTGPLTQQGAQAAKVNYTLTGNSEFVVELCNGSNCSKSAVSRVAVSSVAGAGATSSAASSIIAGTSTASTSASTSSGTSAISTASSSSNTSTASAPAASTSNSAYPCSGVIPGQVNTVTPACLAILESIKFGGEKLVPGKIGHLPVDAQGKAQKEALGYFVEWGPYDRSFPVSKINAAQYSKVLFSFLRLMPDGSLKIMDEWATSQASHGMALAAGGAADLFNWQQDEQQRGHMLALTYLKARHPHLKTAFSIGGWTLSGQFSNVMANPTSRAAFVKNAIAFANKYGFDGIDIDWEYPVVGGNRDASMPGVNYVEVNPGNPTDAQNFVQMLSELRAAVNAETTINIRTKTGKKEISVAVGLGPKTIDALNYSSFLPYVDTINLMAYDFNGGWSTLVSHNAPMYNNKGAQAVSQGGDEMQAEFNNYDAILNILWNASGVKGQRKSASLAQNQRKQILDNANSKSVLSKLILGVAYYGRAWSSDATRPTTSDYTPWFKGSMATAGSFGNGVWDSSDVLYLRDAQPQKMILGNRKVSQTVTSAQWLGEAWDQYSCANLAWINAGGKQQIVSYNDEDSIQSYARFVVDNGLAGTMVWEMDGDTHGDNSYRLSTSMMYGLARSNVNINNKTLKPCILAGRE